MRRAALLALLCSVPFLHLGRRVLWPPDEGRYAIEVREMAASGDWIVPTYGGEPHLDKPPLFMWLGAAASLASGGVSEATVRLPSAAAAALCVAATFLIGTRLFDPRTGLLGALVLATSGRFLLYSQWAATDMLLSSLVAAALAAAVAGRAAPRDDAAAPSIPSAGVAFAAACALAVLAKGPVGALLPVLIVLADGVAAHPREPRRWPAAVRRLAAPWSAGLAVFLLLAVPWFALLGLRLGAPGLREILLRQNVSRFLDAWNAQQPWHFYFKVFPMDFLPWSAFVLLALLPVRDAGAASGAWRFLRTWFALVFAFFSAASGKSPEYLMPLLPAASLMAARLFVLAETAGREATGGAAWEKLLRRGLPAAGAVLAAAGAAGAWFLAERGGRLLPGASWPLGGAAAAVAAGALILVREALAGRATRGAAALATSVLLVRLVLAGPLMDAGNALNVAPQVGRGLAEMIGPDTVVGVGRKGADYIMYYAPVRVTPLPRARRIEAFLRSGGPRLLILKGREHAELAERLRPLAEVVARWGDEERGFVALRPLGSGGT